jgi:hypothetical protein
MLKLLISFSIMGYLVVSGIVSFSSSKSTDTLNIHVNYKNLWIEGEKQVENIKSLKEESKKEIEK